MICYAAWICNPARSRLLSALLACGLLLPVRLAGEGLLPPTRVSADETGRFEGLIQSIQQNGNVRLITTDRTFWFYDYRTKQWLRVPGRPCEARNSLLGKQVVLKNVTGCNGTMQKAVPLFFNPRTAEPLGTDPATRSQIERALGVGLNVAGTRLAFLDTRGQIHFVRRYKGRWSPTHTVPVADWPGSGGLQTLRVLRFSPNLQWLALYDWRGYYASIYNTASGQKTHRSEYYQSPLNRLHQSLVFSSDGQRYFDGRRIRWSSNGRIQVCIPILDQSLVKQAVFAPDGLHLAVLLHQGYTDVTAKPVSNVKARSIVAIWSVDTNRELEPGAGNDPCLGPDQSRHSGAVFWHAWPQRITAMSLESRLLWLGDANGSLWHRAWQE
ncbi:MAG: hypothetical protein KDK39_19200 [Leptospiraceae bacterium]|nr:hypothetical protein [Leptospiraceae bacterium]